MKALRSTPVPLPPPSLTPQVSDKTSLLAGTPLGIVGLLFWKTYTGEALSDVYALALGAVFASVAGYIGYVVKTLIDRAIARKD